MANPGDSAVHLALEQVGKPYVWNTRGPTTFDCSGLIYYAYLHGAGKTISSGSLAQSTIGVSVSPENLRPGDILCYDWFDAGQVGHTALYIGNNQVVEAFNEKQGVVVNDAFAGGHGEAFRFARRPFPYADTSNDPMDSIIKSIVNVIISALNKPDTNTQIVTANTNLRGGPGTSYAIKGLVTSGSKINLLSPTPTSANGYQWYNVRTTNYGDGWMIDTFNPV